MEGNFLGVKFIELENGASFSFDFVICTALLVFWVNDYFALYSRANLFLHSSVHKILILDLYRFGCHL